MATIEDHGIACQQAPHESGKLGRLGTKEQVEVVGEKRPGKAFGAGRDQQRGQAFNKQRFVVVIKKNIALFDATHHHMLEKAGDINTGCSWHGGEISMGKRLSQLN